MRNVEGYRNYDKSEFEEMAAISEDDSVLEEIWKKEYTLKEFVKPTLFKSYEKIKARLDLVLGTNTGKTSNDAPTTEDRFKKDSRENFNNVTTRTNDPNADDELEYFKSLASGTGEDVPF